MAATASCWEARNNSSSDMGTTVLENREILLGHKYRAVEMKSVMTVCSEELAPVLALSKFTTHKHKHVRILNQVSLSFQEELSP